MKISICEGFFASLNSLKGGWPDKRKSLFDCYRILFQLPGYDRNRREYASGYCEYLMPDGLRYLVEEKGESSRTVVDLISEPGPADISRHESQIRLSSELSDLVYGFAPANQDSLLSALLSAAFAPSFCMLLDALTPEERNAIKRNVQRPYSRKKEDIEEARQSSRHIFNNALAMLGIREKEDALERALARLQEEEPDAPKSEIIIKAIGEKEAGSAAEGAGDAKVEPVPEEGKPAAGEKTGTPEEPAREPYVRPVKSKAKDFSPAFDIPEPKKRKQEPVPKPAKRTRDVKVDPADLERAILKSLAENYRNQLLSYRKVEARPLSHVTLADREIVVTYGSLDEAFKKLDSRIRKNGLRSSENNWAIFLALSVEEEDYEILKEHYPGKVFYTDEPGKGRPRVAIIVKPGKGAEGENATTFVRDKRADYMAPPEENAVDPAALEDEYPFLDDLEDEWDGGGGGARPDLPYGKEQPAHRAKWHCYLCGNKKLYTGTPSKTVTLSSGKTVYLCKKHKDRL